jgi:hypothetical protein
VSLNLQNILTEVPLYTRAAKGPAVGYWPVDTCCRWCLVAMEAVVVAAGATVEAIAMKALASEVPTLAGKGRL